MSLWAPKNHEKGVGRASRPPWVHRRQDACAIKNDFSEQSLLSRWLSQKNEKDGGAGLRAVGRASPPANLYAARDGRPTIYCCL